MAYAFMNCSCFALPLGASRRHQGAVAEKADEKVRVEHDLAMENHDLLYTNDDLSMVEHVFIHDDLLQDK